ncbi:MAG: protein phosphatase 2C domain-containing protein, partial [Chloroflexi bacterium]|nr:protein phosphatase 2C domain-containing protein [Chloroflexota bacterium]
MAATSVSLEVVEIPAAAGCRVAAASRIGSRRAINEDSWLVLPPSGQRPLLLAVLDGVGGHAAGEQASTAAAETLVRSWRNWVLDHHPSSAEIQRALVAAAQAADEVVRLLPATDLAFEGAATTLTAAALTDDVIILAHAGDSRAYLVRHDRARQLTEDHTWVAEEVASKRLDPQQVQRHPMRNVITRFLGNPHGCVFDVVVAAHGPADTLVLCTDGISNVVADSELAAGDASRDGAAGAADAVRHIMGIVAARNGGDDATVVVLAFSGDASGAPRTPPPDDRFGLRRGRGRQRPVLPRRALLVAATTAAVAAATGAVTAGVYAVPKALDQVLGPLRTPPLPAAEAYLTAWQAGRYDALYDQLSPAAQRAVEREAFVRRHEAIAAEMTLTALTAGIEPETPFERAGHGQAAVPFEAVYTTA